MGRGTDVLSLFRTPKVWPLVALGATLVLLAVGVIMAAKDPVTLSGHAMQVMSVAFSPDGAVLASGAHDTTVKLWDVRTRKEIATLDPPEGRYLGPEESEGTIYDPVKGKPPPFVNSVAFSPDGKALAVGANDDTVRLWDLGTKKQTLKIRLEPNGPFGKSNAVNRVVFSPDGKTVASGSCDGVVRLWSAETGKLERELKGHMRFIYSVSFSPDGKALASSSSDKTVRLWDVASGETKLTLTGHTENIWAVAFSPDCKYLASGAGDLLTNPPTNELKLWEVSSGKELATLKGHRGAVNSVAFSPDGKVLASGGGSTYLKLGEVLLWDVAKQQQIIRRTDHSDVVFSVAFSPDGKWLASGSADKTVKLWEVSQLIGP